ncbi:hypothetical protein CK203_008567 [Vitis vinifera]|uniref:Uncharacterized protein n=1 Tax=Vitis vinifera TaxID=29760 RepID=A0A438KD14_VITVI|nr:hypothetical protein CK203_008567 [Vitis vinifera]
MWLLESPPPNKNELHKIGNLAKLYSGTPKCKKIPLKECPKYNLLGLIFNPSTATGVLHYSSTQDPPNTNDEDEVDDNLEHGGVHVDVDIEIPNDLYDQRW